MTTQHTGLAFEGGEYVYTGKLENLEFAEFNAGIADHKRPDLVNQTGRFNKRPNYTWTCIYKDQKPVALVIKSSYRSGGFGSFTGMSDTIYQAVADTANGKHFKGKQLASLLNEFNKGRVLAPTSLVSKPQNLRDAQLIVQTNTDQNCISSKYVSYAEDSCGNMRLPEAFQTEFTVTFNNFHDGVHCDYKVKSSGILRNGLEGKYEHQNVEETFEKFGLHNTYVL